MDTQGGDGPKDRQAREEAVRRVVGLAALRKLRRMADEDHVQTVANRTLGRKLLVLILILAALGLAFLLKNAILV